MFKGSRKISADIYQKMEKMSNLSLATLNDAVEAFLRRDYVMADSVVDKAKSIHSFENDIISLLNSEDKTIHHESVKTNIKLILEDIRRIVNMQVTSRKRQQ